MLFWHDISQCVKREWHFGGSQPRMTRPTVGHQPCVVVFIILPSLFDKLVNTFFFQGTLVMRLSASIGLGRGMIRTKGEDDALTAKHFW